MNKVQPITKYIFQSRGQSGFVTAVLASWFRPAGQERSSEIRSSTCTNVTRNLDDEKPSTQESVTRYLYI